MAGSPARFVTVGRGELTHGPRSRPEKRTSVAHKQRTPSRRVGYREGERIARIRPTASVACRDSSTGTQHDLIQDA